ncbi:hypothetical protein L3Q82_004951 [Scortum barcoo]|uniref:Uncharacterized protein n=1 Tax=Scortum barcoo TaxID=214431 RepID=A0ACB8VEC4_9TELE|nr:hypothetical protein L3Q82_004951 [Scortum barcoo]
MDGARPRWRAEQETEGAREVSVAWGLSQWTGLAVLAVPGPLVWLATPADMDRHRGRGGFRGAKQPRGISRRNMVGEGSDSVA